MAKDYAKEVRKQEVLLEIAKLRAQLAERIKELKQIAPFTALDVEWGAR